MPASNVDAEDDDDDDVGDVIDDDDDDEEAELVVAHFFSSAKPIQLHADSNDSLPFASTCERTSAVVGAASSSTRDIRSK